ncbi:MAG: hypothetical protein HY323_08105 [Betaproteobacteria bacterium]|nr:hypothetical protein [Betaproteobacteria bacterium]
MPDRELGGYATSVALGGGGPSIREVDIIVSPAAATASAIVEQTFTVPGLLASDRIAYCIPTTSQGFAATSTILLAGIARVSAISVIAIPFVETGTSGHLPTTSATWAIGIASQRVIP